MVGEDRSQPEQCTEDCGAPHRQGAAGCGGDVGRWRRGQGWGGVPREDLQGLLSGQGSTVLRGQILTVVDVPVILQVEFQQSKLYVWMVAQIQFIDRVL